MITTSAKEDHLRVLWGEIGRYLQTAKHPLDFKRGGPLYIMHQDIRKIVRQPDGKFERCPLSYLTGLVASPDSEAAMQGHHIAKTGDGIPRTLFISDESSSVRDEYYKYASTWANRVLVIGNTWPCENFFKRGVTGGDLPALNVNRQPILNPVTGTPARYYRKIIKIRAQDSPNVRLAEAQIAAGVEPTDEIIIPGVKSYSEYIKNRATWDVVQQTVSLDAEFYEGAETKLFPVDWLDRAASPELYRLCQSHPAEAIGIDPAEGGDRTALCAINSYGIKELISLRTPDTNEIVRQVLAFANRHKVVPHKVVFDRGGGGKQHVDRLKASGFNCRTMAFGESANPLPKRARFTFDQKIENTEEHYAYLNRRAEVYSILSLLVDPASAASDPRTRCWPLERLHSLGFCIPGPNTPGCHLLDGTNIYAELRHQLTKMPKLYDPEGRVYLPPKRNKNPDSKIQSLEQLIGHSPDEADAVVLAVFALYFKSTNARAGAIA